MGIDPQDDEVRELTGLLDACHRVLRHVLVFAVTAFRRPLEARPLSL
jgi:hypothetical protein